MSAAGPCPDCGVAVGVPHQEGCDVALCKHCGAQALQCGMHGNHTTTWTGTWPGKVEAAELGVGLNELTAMHASGQLVWNPDTERLVAEPDTPERVLHLVAALVPVDNDGDDMLLCPGCGGFELTPGQVAHQPGCVVLRARRLAGHTW